MTVNAANRHNVTPILTKSSEPEGLKIVGFDELKVVSQGDVWVIFLSLTALGVIQSVFLHGDWGSLISPELTKFPSSCFCRSLAFIITCDTLCFD